MSDMLTASASSSTSAAPAQRSPTASTRQGSPSSDRHTNGSNGSADSADSYSHGSNGSNGSNGSASGRANSYDGGNGNGYALRRRLAWDIELLEKDGHVQLSFAAPCHSVEQLTFRTQGHSLTVEARWDDEAEAGPVLFARKHTFELDEDVDVSRMNVSFANGVVTLTLPKLPA